MMFVREKKNKSGSVSVQIIDKTNGYRVLQTVGSAIDPDEIRKLVLTARRLIKHSYPDQLRIFSVESSGDLAIENFLPGVSNAQMHTIGPELIFSALFGRIGFNKLPDELFRHITVARLAYPTSKLKTAACAATGASKLKLTPCIAFWTNLAVSTSVWSKISPANSPKPGSEPFP